MPDAMDTHMTEVEPNVMGANLSDGDTIESMIDDNASNGNASDTQNISEQDLSDAEALETGSQGKKPSFYRNLRANN